MASLGKPADAFPFGTQLPRRVGEQRWAALLRRSVLVRIKTKLTSHRPPVWAFLHDPLLPRTFVFISALNGLLFPVPRSAFIYLSAVLLLFHCRERIHAAERTGSPAQAGAQHGTRFHYSILPVRGKDKWLHLLVGRTRSGAPSVGSKRREGACARNSALPKT